MKDRRRFSVKTTGLATGVCIRSRRLPGLVPSCAEGGVLGILPGVVGLIQATEVIKLILGEGQPLQGRLMLYDALSMKFRELKIRRNPECQGQMYSVKELIDYQQFCGVPHQEAPLPAPVSSTDITPQEVKQMIDSGARLPIGGCA